MVSSRVMKFRVTLYLVVSFAVSVDAMAAFSTAPGYTSKQLYTTAGTFTTIGGLDRDGGSLYFAQYRAIKSLDVSDNSVQTVGTIADNTDNSLVIRNNGTTYTSYGVSYNSPYPYKMGYIDGSGNYVNQLDEDGIYDAAVSPAGECYIVVNPDALGSKIFGYNWSSGATIEIANIGGYSGGLAFDSAGNLYYAEQTNGRILRFTAAEVAGGGLTAADADVVLNITAGFIEFDSYDNFYATTGWGATLAKYDLASQVKLADIAYGGIGQFLIDGGNIYAVDTNWSAYASTIQQITAVPEPTTMVLLGLGGLFPGIRRRRIKMQKGEGIFVLKR